MGLEEFWEKLRRYFGWLLGLVGIALAWISGFDLIEKTVQSQTLISVWANIYVVMTAILALSFTAYRQWLTIRKEKYANVTTNLHHISTQIRNAQTFMEEKLPSSETRNDYSEFMEDCKGFIVRILDQVCAIFASITGTHCRASVKVIYRVNEKIYFYTLTRDELSKSKCRETDNKRLDSNHDALAENPILAELFNDKNEKWHFICNDLTGLETFKTTSVAAYDPEFLTSTNGGSGVVRRKKSWPLPYRSTIVAVIRQGSFEGCSALQTQVVGFLTVDSESRGVFHERWDVQIMFMVADALYPVLTKCLEIQSRITHQGS